MKKSVSLTKKSLSLKESIIIGSMLFGMFFGAGNLIFPVHMGQLAGSNVWPAIIGFTVTGVGLPLLGVASLGISKKNSLFELSSLVGDNYKYFFTILLYLTIGPFFAIPRCATTSFTIGIAPLLGGTSEVVPRFIFTLIFFSIVLFLAINPNKIMTFIGQYINPIFLLFLSVLIIVSFFNPIKQINPILPQGDYASMPFFKGFLEGYNTMDAIASLAFGITVITVIQNLGIKNENAIAFNIIKAGLIGCGLMAIIYILTTLMGTMSIGMYEVSQNGGQALAQISKHYFGNFGIYLLLATVSLACLKTALALVVSCSEMFNKMFPNVLSIKKWSIVFTVFSFIVSNFGLNAIINYSIPALMFLYPLTITIILLSLFGKLFNYDKTIFLSTTIFTFNAAIFDFVAAFPRGNILSDQLIDSVTAFGQKFLPFSNLGLGWLVPAIVGFEIGLILKSLHNKKLQ